MSECITQEDAMKMSNERAIYIFKYYSNYMLDLNGRPTSEVYFAVQKAIKALEKTAQSWIPVTERLPEEDKEVLITYKGKGDELDKPYSNIDITTYGQMYFGGNKVGNYKHWRSPFQYFNDNYEVTAWMPMPEAYEGN